MASVSSKKRLRVENFPFPKNATQSFQNKLCFLTDSKAENGSENCFVKDSLPRKKFLNPLNINSRIYLKKHFLNVHSVQDLSYMKNSR